MITDFRLKVFRAVADRLSFTRAAEELFITQPAVTKHINELERQLAVPLFIRHGNSISLTPEGVLLLTHARKILASYQELNDAFATDSSSFEGEIVIGASTTISQYVLPAILSRFKRRYPAVCVTLVNGNTEQIERMIVEKKIDFGVIEGSAGNPQLHYETFMEDELVLVTASSNQTLKRDEIAISDLPTLSWVIRETGSGTLDVVERALALHGLTFRSLHIEMQLGSTEGIKHYLYGSETVAFISIQAILEELHHNLLRIIEITDLHLMRKFSFVTRHGQSNRLCSLFKQFCINNYNYKL